MRSWDVDSEWAVRRHRLIVVGGALLLAAMVGVPLGIVADARRSSPAPTAPSAPAIGLPDGTWRVGADVAPGTYRAYGDGSGMSCYWERLSGFSGAMADIITNGLDTAPVVVTILPSDAGFKSTRCGTWTKVQ